MSAHHVEGALVVVLLHELDGAFVLSEMFTEHHVLHPALVVRHISSPESVLPLLDGWGRAEINQRKHLRILAYLENLEKDARFARCSHGPLAFNNMGGDTRYPP